MKSRSIALAAVSTALSVVFMLISNYVPVIRTTPLILACIAIQIAYLTAGFWAGFLSMLASLGICFAFAEFGTTFILTLVLFYPYCLVAYLIRGYKYRGIGILIRMAASGAVANISLCILYFLTDYLVFDLSRIVGMIGGYPVLAIVFTIISWIFDFVFLNATKYLADFLKRGKR